MSGVCPVSNLNDDLPWAAGRCTYTRNADMALSPHRHASTCAKPKHVSHNVLQQIGNTPLIRIQRVGKEQGIECEIYAKCEFLNPGGSIKDRIALRMVEEAEAAGTLKPGDVIIEPTSGNTGVGIALVAAVKGYRCIIVLPENMSMDKVNTLKALGAEVVRTKAGVPYHSPHSHISTAYRMKAEITNAVVLDQYRNPYNSLAHYDVTAQEIIDAFSEDGLDMLVMGVGTGGSITGMARKIKQKFPNCKIIGVDPEGSVIAGEEDPTKKKVKFEVEGIGYDFVPQVFDDQLIDKWYKAKDRDTFLMARRLIKEEGLLVGGSSGAAMYNALLAIKDYNLTKQHRCVVLLADTIRNYLSKFVSDAWMRERKYLSVEPVKKQLWWWDLDIGRINLPLGNYVDWDTTVATTIDILHNINDDVLVVDDDKTIVGRMNTSGLMTLLTDGTTRSSDKLRNVSLLPIKYVERDGLTIGFLSHLLELHDVVAVKSTEEETVTSNEVYGIGSRKAVLEFLRDGEIIDTN